MASQPAASSAANQLTGEVSGVELRQASLADLDGEHRRLLVQAVERILCTEIAEVTYAQIIDGLPIADVAYDTRSPPYGAHPLDERHEELCPGMLEKAREFRAGFQPDILTFKAKVSSFHIPYTVSCRRPTAYVPYSLVAVVLTARR